MSTINYKLSHRPLSSIGHVMEYGLYSVICHDLTQPQPSWSMISKPFGLVLWIMTHSTSNIAICLTLILFESSIQ